MRNVVIETLEKRKLLAGVTLLTHGWNGRLWGFVETSAAYITDRFGGPQNVPQYTMTIGPTSGGGLTVQSVTHHDGTATPQSSNNGEIILIVDWRSIDQ